VMVQGFACYSLGCLAYLREGRCVWAWLMKTKVLFLEMVPQKRYFINIKIKYNILISTIESTSYLTIEMLNLCQLILNV
jgi:hypothetical protein